MGEKDHHDRTTVNGISMDHHRSPFIILIVLILLIIITSSHSLRGSVGNASWFSFSSVRSIGDMRNEIAAEAEKGLLRPKGEYSGWNDEQRDIDRMGK